MTKAQKYIAAFIIFDLIIIGAVFLFIDRANAPEPAEPQQNNSQSQQTTQQPSNAFDTTQFSTTDPGSIWVIVNKKRPIDLGYVPANLVQPKVALNTQKTDEENSLRQDTAAALEVMLTAAEDAGHQLFLASGYRSSQLQKSYYDGYVARDGQTAADQYSARPGTSEHQTGLSFDLAPIDRTCYLEICFGDTPSGKWLAQNAPNYGFIVRYPAGKESITGYQYEPWHFRYVGTELARELQQRSATMEEFFGIN